MKNKILIPLIIIGGLIAFFSFKYKGKSIQTKEDKRQLVIEAVMKAVEGAHFSPRTIDDEFSSRVYQKAISQFDLDKLYFTKKDITKLKTYEFKIDDEIKQSSIEFFDSLDAIYLRDVTIAEKFYTKILSEPFSFKTNEKLQLNADKEEFATNEEELMDRWREHLKYRVLSKYIDLKNEQDKKKENKDSVNAVMKTDLQLEEQAREDVKKSYDRYFKRIHKWKDDDRFTAYVNFITTNEDPHTEYFPPREKKGFDEQMSGSFFGIGALLKQENDKTIISSIVTGSPSWKQGDLKSGDEIQKVAQDEATPVDIGGYEIDDVVKLIRGEKGTIVKLTVKKTDGSIKIIPIIRGVVQLEETFAKSAIIKSSVGQVGYIFLPEFYADFNHTSGRRCAVDVEKEVRKLKDAGVAGIIIDLRYNSGGSLGDVVDMSGIFIGKNPVVQVKSNHASPSVLKAQAADSPLYSGPLAVMISGNSASASEILAAVLQDYKRAVIVGSTSYGKGSVQKMVSLDDMIDPMTRLQFTDEKNGSDGFSIGALKLTMEKFYRVNGGSTQLKGVTPDITLPDLYEYEDDDMGERHSKSALPWDVIPAANYKPTNSIVNLKQLAQNSENRVNNNAIFKLIDENAAQVKKRKDNNVVSLNEAQYKKEQEQLNSLSKRIEEAQKKATLLEMINLDADKERINLDSASVKKNTDWLKNISKDVYICETVNIINDLYMQLKK